MNREVTSDQDARWLLSIKGYQLKHGHVWWIENDDPDNFTEYRIGPAHSHLEAWKTLQAWDWPRRPAWGEVNV